MQKQKITDKDLYERQYSMETLIENIDELTMKIILMTQKLTAEFCVHYVLNEDYMTCVEDTYYFMTDKVLYYQKHLTEEDLVNVGNDEGPILK